MSKEKVTLEDERFAFFLASGAALAAFSGLAKLERDERFEKVWIRLIPFTKAVMVVAFAHRDELAAAWAQAKSELGPFGIRFDQEESDV